MPRTLLAASALVGAVLWPAASPAAAPSGPAAKEAIRQVIQAHAGDVAACYAPELEKDPGLEGKVALAWTIDADGSVRDVSVHEAGTTLPNRRVLECMVSRVGAWRFAARSEGSTVFLTYGWVLRPPGDLAAP